MDITESLRDIAIVKTVSGLIGGLISLKWLPGTRTEKVIMLLGSGALSFFGAELLAEYLDMKKGAIGLLGLLLGIFGMAILSKVFEAIAALDAKRIASDVWDWFARKWKA